MPTWLEEPDACVSPIGANSLALTWPSHPFLQSCYAQSGAFNSSTSLTIPTRLKTSTPYPHQEPLPLGNHLYPWDGFRIEMHFGLILEPECSEESFR